MEREAGGLIKVLDKYDDVAVRTATKFLERHKLSQLVERVRLGYAADFGAIKLLKHVLVKLFHFKSRDFVEFYEGIYEDRETPHYEDLLAAVTLILAALAAVGAYLSPIIGVEYAKWREKAKKDKQYILEEDYKELLTLFKYLIMAFALRDAYFIRKISKEQFRELKKVAGDLILEPGSENSDRRAGELDQIWQAFERTTNLPVDDELRRELEELALAEIQRLPMQHKGIARPREDGTIISKGLGVSLGQAKGLVKVVNSADDIVKVRKGDVGVFRYCEPDMVPALTKCAAAIGLERCGGFTGHLAIISRELGIPCVVQLEKNDHFVDGKLVWVDGNTGDVIIKA
jgi:phosphohistidine swiveling domain-containing protein